MSGNDLAARIKAARKHHGWTQDQLAARMMASGRAATVSDWETGKTMPEADNLAELVRALHKTDARWLLTGEGEMVRTPPDQAQLKLSRIREIVEELATPPNEDVDDRATLMRHARSAGAVTQAAKDLPAPPERKRHRGQK
jgi:transcriptional regulator with XRE-family HTH domain